MEKKTLVEKRAPLRLLRRVPTSTRAHSRHGKPRTFPSALPNGSRATRSGLCACDLDCIFCEEDQTYYILDVLRWKDQAMIDCPSDFRLWWLASKLTEGNASVQTSTNPCRFVPLQPLVCSPAQVSHRYTCITATHASPLHMHHRYTCITAAACAHVPTAPCVNA